VRSSRLTRVALSLAAVWSSLLVLAALTLGSPTLVQVNGAAVLVPVGFPLGATVVVSVALWRRRRRARPGPGLLACVVTGLVGLLVLAGMLSIGIVVAPVLVLLVIACTDATSPRPVRWVGPPPPAPPPPPPAGVSRPAPWAGSAPR
jgi:hypothetical protein